jgi:putative endonuclease
MADPHSLGEKGEEHAAALLKGKGYTIRHRNWVSGRRELDIVAENKDFIVFAEVKTRAPGFIVDPREAVSREKQRSIIYAAENYIRKYNINKESRFDVIIVISDGKNFTAEHIEDAFYPTLR